MIIEIGRRGLKRRTFFNSAKLTNILKITQITKSLVIWKLSTQERRLGEIETRF